MFEKQNIQETVNELKSDAVKGLTDGEAFRRLQQNGRNEMKAARKKTKIQLFLEQLKDPLIYILLIAAVVSVFLGELSDALSATVDSWAVGMTYKAQKIKIPLAAKGMISLVSGMTALIAVLFGRLLSEILPIAAIQASGGTLLAVMGVKALWQIKKEKEKTNYDLDLSQKIETWEAVWMGTVLSADSFLVGIGLVQYGNQAYAFPALVTVLTGGFLILAQQIRYWRIFDYISAAFLTLAGIFQLFTTL